MPDIVSSLFVIAYPIQFLIRPTPFNKVIMMICDDLMRMILISESLQAMDIAIFVN